MTASQIHDIDGEFSLTFECGDLPADEAILAADHEPNGYFWEGVATLLAPELVDELELDSESGMFCAIGERDVLEKLQAVLEPVMSNGDAVRAVLERAEAAGFEFDD